MPRDKTNRGFICKDCDFLDYTGELDRCPYCRNDDWRVVLIEKCNHCSQWVKKDLESKKKLELI